MPRWALTRNLADAVNHGINELLADGVVTTSICTVASVSGQSIQFVNGLTVVRGILLSADEQLGVEQVLVSTSTDLVDWLQVDVRLVEWLCGLIGS